MFFWDTVCVQGRRNGGFYVLGLKRQTLHGIVVDDLNELGESTRLEPMFVTGEPGSRWEGNVPPFGHSKGGSLVKERAAMERGEGATLFGVFGIKKDQSHRSESGKT